MNASKAFEENKENKLKSGRKNAAAM